MTSIEAPRSKAIILLFVANGVVATGCNYLALVFLVEVLKLRSIGLSGGIASILGIIVSYIGNSVFVFDSRKSSGNTFPRFLMLYVGIALLNSGAVWLWSDVAHLPYKLGFIVATGLATVVSFLGNRHFVFPK